MGAATRAFARATVSTTTGATTNDLPDPCGHVTRHNRSFARNGLACPYAFSYERTRMKRACARILSERNVRSRRRAGMGEIDLRNRLFFDA